MADEIGWNRRIWPWLAPAMLMLFGLTAQIAAYWPGIMIYDAIRQYGQALSGRFDDWHPPSFEWLWRQLLPIHSGPAAMLVLQLLLYWGGFATLVAWAVRQRRPGLAAAIAAAALLPIPFALIGAILKDSLMAGALLVATAILAWLPARRAWGLRSAAIALLLFAATLRFNGFLAELPLLVALLPASWWRTPKRLVMVAALATLPLMLALPVANKLLHAQRSGVELSLLIYDLGGITEHSGVDVFPNVPVANPVAVNHGCYSPVNWDPYAWWGPSPCPIGFDSIRATLAANGQSAYRLWLAAVVAHPIAYAEHRLQHFNHNVHFLVRGETQPPTFSQSDPNPWNYAIRPNPVLAAIDAVISTTTITPLGWPIWWMAMAIAALILSPALPSRRLIVPIALSALLYGAGYLLVSVASEMRYHLWTITGAALASAITLSDLGRGAVVKGRRIAWAAMPLVIVTVFGVAWRVM